MSDEKKEIILKDSPIKNMQDIIKDFAGIVTEVQERFQYLIDEIAICDQKDLDYRHKIELEEDLSACEGYKLYKEYRDFRRYRRCIKNEKKLLEPLIRYLREHKEINSISLFKLTKELATTSRCLETAHYNLRYNPKPEEKDKQLPTSC